MFYGGKKSVFAIVLVLASAFTSRASGEIVAALTGPQEFDGSSTMVSLNNGDVGLEGTLQFDFKADSTNSGVLWYLADVYGGVKGEYRIYLENNVLTPALWGSSGYAVTPISANGLSFSDTTNWHTLRFAWKQGENTLFTLDGGTTPDTSRTFSNAVSLTSFTSTLDVLGAYPASSPWNCFDGSIRNVVLTNAYNAVPEPTTSVLLGMAVFGLVAYAWRKKN